MSPDERWIEVWAPDETDSLGIRNLGTQTIEKYRAAEGQRVEAVRWCETHDERARITPLGIETCWPGDDALEDCAVTDAVVILPPKDAA